VNLLDNIIREYGTVIENRGATVIVTIKRHAACESCGACGGLGGGAQAELVLTTENTVGAKVGDLVLLEMPTGKLYQAAFLIYTVPLLMLLAGFTAGQWLGRLFGLTARPAELFGMISGLIAVVLTYVAVHYWDERRGGGVRFQPKLTQIITSAGTTLFSK
jgi:sigma-E factor negative regulatory protein RseC